MISSMSIVWIVNLQNRFATTYIFVLQFSAKSACKKQLRLSEDTVERVVNIQKGYQRQGHAIDFVDFLLDDENEVLRRCDEAERYLLTVTARRTYEDRV